MHLANIKIGKENLNGADFYHFSFAVASDWKNGWYDAITFFEFNS